MASSTTRQQPPWVAPSPEGKGTLPPLRLLNGLTRNKDAFVPADAQGKVVTWYTCGPTVYDDAHLGHARNYVSIDTLRRILRDYFGFKVRFVMNITDVDDKIILRGRQQFLYRQFVDQHGGTAAIAVTPAIREAAKSAFAAYLRTNLTKVPPETTPESFDAAVTQAYPSLLAGQTTEDADAKKRMHIKTVRTAAAALQSPGPLSDFYAQTEDIFLPYLDTQHGADIDSKDHTIFTSLTQLFEERFFDDMRSLNVLYPDVLTRVTEYVPQIIGFIEQVMSNGFAYKTPDGSVYFDIAAFEKAGHHYARLEPWNRNDQALLADGEGSLSDKTATKRNESDFALWKASKKGEPAWPSPWGEGRPGWHIECSAMASHVLGKVIDIHSGGIDLKFPHHDNELAQSEAYWTAEGARVQWINYFIHTGHLSIQGLKMSKSLKNFTTIRSALSQPEWNARALRIAFLLGAWQDGIEVTEELLKATASWESRMNNFFLKALDVAENPTDTQPGQTDEKLLDALESAKTELDKALCDSFNTPMAMRILSSLVSDFNVAQSEASHKGLADDTVLSLARWVTRIVIIFGLDAKQNDGPHDPQLIGWSGIAIPDGARPYVYAVSRLRDKLRTQARSGRLDHAVMRKLAEAVPLAAPATDAARPYRDVSAAFVAEVSRLADAQAPARDVLELSDRLRDTHLWELGIYLEDRDPPLHALVRPVDGALAAQREERRVAAENKARLRAAKEAEDAEKARLAEEKARVSPHVMFRTDGEWTEWDDEGIPTKDAKGEAVTKSQRKKLVKEWERHKKMHEKWLAMQGEGGA